MSTIDEIFATISEADATAMVDEVLIIDPNTRQINLPGSELIFGVESDTYSERKYFQCSRYVGDNIDLSSCFIRVNYRNANGDVDAYLVDDVTVAGDNVMFSWAISSKVIAYKGQIKFVVCACRPGGKGARAVEWNTTTAIGISLEGLEPDVSSAESDTADVIAQLLATVEAQTANVENTGVAQVASVKSEGATQINAVKTASEAEKTAMVAEIEAKGTNTLASIPNDYTAMQSAVDTLTRTVAPGIVCEVEGTEVAVSDASNQAMRGLRIFGKSTQDGVPSPDAPVEIVSVDNPVVTVCGKNLLPNAATNESYNGITITVNEDKSITVNGTATGNVFYAPYRFTFRSGQSYVLSGCPRNGSADTYFMYINNLGGARDYGNGVVVNLDEDFTSDVGFSIRSGTTVNNLTFYPMVKVGTTVNEYEPRKNIQTINLVHSLPGIPVTSGGNYTDSNGQQWICDEVDFERGVYVQRIHRMTLDGSSDESIVRQTIGDSSKIRLLITNSSIPMTTNSELGCAMCDRAPRAFAGESGTYGGHQGISVDKSGNVHLFLDAICQMTEAEIRTWLATTPTTIIYALATPIETPLTETELAAYRALHTNKPNTTFLNDAGAHMAVEYVADTKLYIDNKIATLVSGT